MDDGVSGVQNDVSNIVLIPGPDQQICSTDNSTLQQQIIAIVTDVGQQLGQSSAGIQPDMFQDVVPITSFTNVISEFQQPINVISNLEQLTNVTNSGTSFNAFDAISVLTNATNQQQVQEQFNEPQPAVEKKVFSSVKARLSLPLISAVRRKSSSLESALTNIATQLGIQNIVCEYEEATENYTLDGDLKEMAKLQDILIHYFDENLEFDQEKVLAGVKDQRKKVDTADKCVGCHLLLPPVTRSGRSVRSKVGSGDESYGENDLSDDDEEYSPNKRNSKRSKRKGNQPKKLRELIELAGKNKAKKTVPVAVAAPPPQSAIISILSNPANIPATPLKFSVNQSLLHTTALPQVPQTDMPASSNEDVVSLLDKPLEGDDVRKYIIPSAEQQVAMDSGVAMETPGVAMEASGISMEASCVTMENPGVGMDSSGVTMGGQGVAMETSGMTLETKVAMDSPSSSMETAPVSMETEDFVKTFVNISAQDILQENDMSGEMKPLAEVELKQAPELPPVTLSDEEALEALEREEVEAKIKIAKEKTSSSSHPKAAKTKLKGRKNYDAIMPFKYFCSLCSFKSKRESHFEKHKKIHSENPHLTILKCNLCDFKTIRQCHLKRHTAEHSRKAIQCRHCNYKTTEEDLLRKHIAVKHNPTSERKTCTEVQQCPKCDYKTSRPYHFQRHLRVHADILGMLSGNETDSAVKLVQSYQCPKCPYQTSKKEHFVRHLGDVHSEHRPYLCDTCGKSFKRADALKQHRDVHLEKTARTLPYQCNICKKTFKSKAHLNDHKTKHTNVRAYLCEICGASFKTKSVQRKHIVTIHRNPRSYRCPHCEKRFNTKFALQRHSMMHIVPDGLIRMTDVPVPEQQVEQPGQVETQYIQVEVNPSPQLTTIQTIPIMQMQQSGDVQEFKAEETFVEQGVDGTQIVPNIYTQTGEATTALLYLTGNFPSYQAAEMMETVALNN